MTVMGVSWWRFVLGVIGSEAVPILLLVLAMFFVGTKLGARPSQATAEAWGAWIGPIGGALATAVIAWLLARSSTRPVQLGIALGVAVGLFDLGLTLLAAKGAPFRILYVVSALARVIGGALGGVMAGRSAAPGA
jgi:ABC-type uncharacterized transport system permease subunit